MPGYRIYWLDQADHITEADGLIADSDDIVRRGAGEHIGTASAIEVWDGARLVARLAASKAEPRPAAPRQEEEPILRRLLSGARSPFESGNRRLRTV
jgi:hypothetical protein